MMEAYEVTESLAASKVDLESLKEIESDLIEKIQTADGNLSVVLETELGEKTYRSIDDLCVEGIPDGTSSLVLEHHDKALLNNLSISFSRYKKKSQIRVQLAGNEANSKVIAEEVLRRCLVNWGLI